MDCEQHQETVILEDENQLHAHLESLRPRGIPLNSSAHSLVDRQSNEVSAAPVNTCPPYQLRARGEGFIQLSETRQSPRLLCPCRNINFAVKGNATSVDVIRFMALYFFSDKFLLMTFLIL